MSRRTPDQTQSDKTLWQEVARSIKPLHRAKVLGEPQTQPLAAQYVPAAPRQKHALPSLQGKPAGIDANNLKKLKAGDWPIEGRLDLHGFTLATAHPALIRFIHNAYRAHQRCVLVITGRSGVLRSEVPRWCDESELRPYILALAPAPPRRGGAGALCILLRRQRR